MFTISVFGQKLLKYMICAGNFAENDPMFGNLS